MISLEKKGRVVNIIDEKMAEVSIIRESACGSSCSSCGGDCSSSEITVDAKINVKNLKVGDIVKLGGSTKKMLKSTFIAYSIPLILLIAGTVGGTEVLRRMEFQNYEILGFGVGLVGLAISFFIIRILGNKISEDKVDFEINDILKKKR